MRSKFACDGKMTLLRYEEDILFAKLEENEYGAN